MPGIFYDNPATLDGLNLVRIAYEWASFVRTMVNIWPGKQNGKAFAFPWEGAPECLIGIQWGASVPISSLACYPIPCLVSSPLYFIVLLLLSSSVVYLSYCFRYYYSISVVIICCCYVLLCSVFLLSIVVIRLFPFFIIYCCYF